jgi:putative spermidine/putrescine transport system ATP-binding protein
VKIATRPTDHLYASPATAFVAEFVGTMNRLPGDLAGGTVAVLGTKVPVRAGGPEAADGPVDVLARPEGLTIAAAESGNGIVTTRTFLGAATRVGGAAVRRPPGGHRRAERRRRDDPGNRGPGGPA